MWRLLDLLIDVAMLYEDAGDLYLYIDGEVQREQFTAGRESIQLYRRNPNIYVEHAHEEAIAPPSEYRPRP